LLLHIHSTDAEIQQLIPVYGQQVSPAASSE
jgi:hypothetical protein